MIGRRVVDRKSVNALVAFTKKRAVTVRKAVDDFEGKRGKVAQGEERWRRKSF